MSNYNEYHAPLVKMERAMASQMARPENIAKDHWRLSPLSDLFHELDRNAAMLQMATDPDEAYRRAANVANFAWMIADSIEGANA